MNIKKTLGLVSAQLAMISIPLSALASDSDNLQVSGRISAAYCDVFGSIEHTYVPTLLASSLPDTGSIAASSLPNYQDGVDGIYFYLFCEGEGRAQISFSITDVFPADLHPDSPANSFALRESHGENLPVGYFTLFISEALINDTDPAGSLQSRTDWLDSYTDHASDVILSDATRQYVYSNQISTQANRLEFKLTPDLVFWGKDKVDPTIEHRFQGRYTVNVIF